VGHGATAAEEVYQMVGLRQQTDDALCQLVL
jgi:hypothetical protein